MVADYCERVAISRMELDARAGSRRRQRLKGPGPASPETIGLENIAPRFRCAWASLAAC